MRTVLDFVNFLSNSSHLDKIYGTRTLYRDRTNGNLRKINPIIWQYVIKFEELTGETLYLVDKGSSHLYYYITCRVSNEEFTDIYEENGSLYSKVEFDGFNLYVIRRKNLDNYFYINTDVLVINARYIILPLKHKIELESNKRIYVVKAADLSLYKFPLLNYPNKSVKKLFKWLLKKKRITIEVVYCWMKNDNYQNWNEIDKHIRLPERNLKSDCDIIDYIDFLENNYIPKYCPTADISLLKYLESVCIDQEDINQFIIEENNRFKIYRGKF